MSKLLRDTLIDNQYQNLQTLSSETGFFETFVSKEENLDFKCANVKLRTSPAYKYKPLNKIHEAPKYKGKIIFPIIETIIIDKGQINYWIFTDDVAGYVMKRNSNKLTKDYILKYLVSVAKQKLIEIADPETDKKFEKILKRRKVDAIMEDIHRFIVISDQNYSAEYQFTDELEYLQYFKEFEFIYLKFIGNLEKIVNIFELFIILSDPNKLTNLILIQNFMDIDIAKTIYCKFSRKDILTPKKFQIYTKNPFYFEEDISNDKNNVTTQDFNQMSNNNNVSNLNISGKHNYRKSENFSQSSFNPNNSMNQHNISSLNNNIINSNTNHKNSIFQSNNAILGKRNHFRKSKRKKIEAIDEDDESKSKQYIDIKELIPLNDNNLAEFIATITKPFIELLEKTQGIFIHEVIILYQKDMNGNFNFRLCDSILCKSRKTPQELQEELKIKENMKNIHDKAIPKEIKPAVKNYEKISKNAFCFGEFCNYNIPKFFKNMNKFNKDELIEYNNIDSKLIERNKNHDFVYVIPYFIIKKSYDNENLVNIVLKAYSIFPKDFNKDKVLQELQRQKKLEEQLKEEENRKEAERIKIEEKIRRMGSSAISSEELKIFLQNEKKSKKNILDFQEGSLDKDLQAKNSHANISRKTSIIDRLKKKKDMDYQTLEKIILRQDIEISDSEEDENPMEENKTGVTLYTPMPGKFKNFNFDKMYSKTHVCGNCNIIYMLIEDFLCNFEDGNTHFKSLNKAKNLLLQGEKLRNPFMGDNIDDDNNDNLLFKEEKTAFSLKKILKRKIKEEKLIEMKKNRPFQHQKIFKNETNKKDEFQKLFDYKIKMNPKLLQLNLLAEKSKNKFFNLILNELKNEPKSLNEKMGMQKPKKSFPRSLEALRMHMGLNSKIMINSDYKKILHLQSSKQRKISRENTIINSYPERMSGIRKPSADKVQVNPNNPINNQTKLDIMMNNQDINIFQEYTKLKLNYKPEIKRLRSNIFEIQTHKNALIVKKKNHENDSSQNKNSPNRNGLSELELEYFQKQLGQDSEKVKKSNNKSNNKNQIKERKIHLEEKDSYSYQSGLDDIGLSSESDYLDIYKNNTSKLNKTNAGMDSFTQKNDISQDEQDKSQRLGKLGDIEELDIEKSKFTDYLNTKVNKVDGIDNSFIEKNLKKSFTATKISYNEFGVNVDNDRDIDNFNRNINDGKRKRKYSIEDKITKKKASIFNQKRNIDHNFLTTYEFSTAKKLKINLNENNLIDINPQFENNKENDKTIEEIDQTKNKIKVDEQKMSDREQDKLNYDSILFNVYQYFLPESQELLSCNKEETDFRKLNNSPTFDEANNVKIAEYYELKHYNSDLDNFKMKKFVYEKLENLNREVVLKLRNINQTNIIKPFAKRDSQNQIFKSLDNYDHSNLEQDSIGEPFTSKEKINKNSKHLGIKGKNYYFNNLDFHQKISKSNIIGENIESFNRGFNHTNENNKERLLHEEDEDYQYNLQKTKKTDSKDNLDKPLNSSEYKQENNKKSHITSIFYYDWAKDPKKYEVPYYFLTTPIMKLNENNVVTGNNPLDGMKTMNIDDFLKIGKFSLINLNQKCQNLLKRSKVFVYDQYTAVPYLITDLKNQHLNGNQYEIEEMNQNNNFGYLNNVTSPDGKNQNNPKANTGFNKNKKTKLLCVVLNDFYDCFTNHYDLMVNALSVHGSCADRFKLINFNFPAQPTTLYSRKNIFNNIYYSKFLDRFLFHLIEKNIFDHTYSIIFIGFGNGGHVALNYVAANEKFFDFINSVVLLNSYCENDENIGKSMIEISKVIENSKNENMIDFFIKTITCNPVFLTQYNNYNINKKFNSNLLPNNNINNISSTAVNFPNINQNKMFNNVNNSNLNANLSANVRKESEIIYKINNTLPNISNATANAFNYQNYNSANFPNYKANLMDLNNLNNLLDSRNEKFSDKFVLNIEENDAKSSYHGFSLITKGYFYNIPFNYSEIHTPIVAFHSSNNCFIPLTNLNNLFLGNLPNSNRESNNLNNFAAKDSRTNLSPISSIDDFTEIHPENNVRRKLVVAEGAHNLIKENPGTVTRFLRNFMDYSFENIFVNKN